MDDFFLILYIIKLVIIVYYDVCFLGVELRFIRPAWQEPLPGISIVWEPQKLFQFLLTKKKGPSLMQVAAEQLEQLPLRLTLLSFGTSLVIRKCHPLASPSKGWTLNQ